MVLESLTGLLTSFMALNPVFLVAGFILFILIAYKLFQALIKAFIVGAIAASFPVIANLMGMNVPITIHSILWFATIGVIAFLMYSAINGGARMARFAVTPFGRLFRKTPVKTVIIREKPAKKS